MTNFNPEGMFMSAEEWQERVLRQEIEGNAIGKKVVMGLGAALVGSAFLTPFVGLPLGVGIIWDAFSKQKEEKHKLDLIVLHGCIAPFLDDYEFRQYLKQVGATEIIEQLKFAIEEEIDLSDAAHNFMMTANPPKQLSGSSPTPQLAASVPVSSPQPTASDITVPVSSSQPTASDISFTPSGNVDQSEEIPDLVGLMAEPLKNSLIVGVPGAGKDHFVSNAMERLKLKSPDTVIFLIDPKDDPRETGYFDYCDYKFRRDIDEMSEEETYEFLMGDKGAITLYDKYCKEHESNSFKKLLVINELPALLKKVELFNRKALQRIKGKFASYASSGGSRGKRIWALAQNAHVEGCGLNGGDKAIFGKIVIGRDESVTELLNILSAKLLEKEHIPTSSQLMAICKQSPVGRAIFHSSVDGGKWFPLPVLPSLSGYDRDTGTFIPRNSNNKTVIQDNNTVLQDDSLTQKEREELRNAIAAVEPSLQQKMRELLDPCQKSLDAFIKEDLNESGEEAKRIKTAIITDLKTSNDTKLLEKFGYLWVLETDFYKAIKLSDARSDEELKFNWFLLTGKELTAIALSELKKKLD